MKKLFLALFFALALPCVGQAQPFSPYGGLLCNKTAQYSASTSGLTQLVAAVTGAPIYVCGYVINVGATATNVGLSYGTGTNCATGTATLTPAFVLGVNGLLVDEAINGNSMYTPNSQALCISTSAGNPVNVIVRYAQGAIQ